MKRLTYPLSVVALLVMGWFIAPSFAQSPVARTSAGTAIPATAGSNAEYQYRSGATSLGAITNTGPVPTASWSIVNAAVFNNFDGRELGVWITPNASLNFRFITQSLTSTPYTVIAKLNCFLKNQDGTTTIAAACGVYLYDGTKFESLEDLNNNTEPELIIRQSSGVTSGGSTITGPTANLTPPSALTVKVVDDGTHRTWYYYTNGGFTQFFQETTATFLTPTSVGVGGLNNGSSDSWVSVNISYWCVANATTCNGL